MKNSTFLFSIALLLFWSMQSQSITSAEYFYNTDPGVGNGTGLSVNTNSGSLTQSFSIPTTGLGEGFHSLYIRTQNSNGNWSHYDRQIIYIKDFSTIPSSVVNAEYFIDSDPGVGLGTPIAISSNPQSFNVTTDPTITEGDHLFCIRVQTEDDAWSLYDCAIFNVDNTLGVENSLYQSVTLLPSPFEDRVAIDASKDVVVKNITVYDVTGSIVHWSEDDSRLLELGHLSSGMYILKMNTPTESATFKLVKR